MTPSYLCKSIGCPNRIEQSTSNPDFCPSCLNKDSSDQLVQRYPNQYKSTGDATEVDVFAVNLMFKVQDNSGCLQHAIHKLLMASGGSNTLADVREARDTLTRYLQLNQP